MGNAQKETGMKNLITCLTVCVLSGVTFATTWTVDDDGKADFDNIQAAIDAASNGDEIIVMPGTYTGSGDEVVNMLGKAVWLHSSKGAEVTIIDGEGARRGIICNSDETSKTIIEGFTITNGYGSGMVNYESSPTLTNCTFTGNTGSYGGGMYNWTASPTLTNCTFVNNTADDPGGFDSGGGGMYNYLNSNPTLTDCTFDSNTADDGGGMYNDNSSPSLDNCTFSSNAANNYGGGVVNDNNSSPTLNGCTFTNNIATNNGGGGMYNLTDSSPTLTDCTFTNNTAGDSGGGMLNVNDSSPTLTGCTFDSNTATNYGGGMRNSASNPTLTDTTVCGNTPDQIYGDWIDNGGNTIADECPECPDINGDGYVNVSDLLAIIDQWGLTDSPADLNFDGIVDVSDLLIVVGNWGECLPIGDCSGNGLVDSYTATVSSPCMGTTIPASDISLALALNSNCSVTGTANVYGETPAVTTTTWSHASGILTIGSFSAAVAESATTFTTPLEQIFPVVAAAVLATFDLLPPREQIAIIANCGSPEAWVSGLQMTWTR